MATYMFATSHDGDKFKVESGSLQSAFESLEFNAVDYTDDEDEAAVMRGAELLVWAWDEDGERHDWTAYFK